MVQPTTPTSQTVSVKRTELSAPDMTNPDRKIIQIQYQMGELPPRFLYIDKDKWSKDAEAKLIKDDLQKRLNPPSETIKI